MKDESGNVYGNLTVIERAGLSEPSNRCVKWVCKCSCGRTTVVNGNNLRFGRARSCGECDKQLRGKQHGRII